MSSFAEIRNGLRKNPRAWLVTGVAGFIGSNLLEQLLLLDQTVVGVDNFSTGYRRNLEEVKTLVTREQWARFRFIEGDISRLEDCQRACVGANYVLHQAALGSVPRSLADPLATHAANVDGFVHMLVAARDAAVQHFVYASSSSVYGDHPDLPKREAATGRPLSPYAATKAMNEMVADVFTRCYGLRSTGLRYFNVFGPRQDPEGAYAAVIPRWFAAALRGEPAQINGDGETSRDFCYVANVIQANLLAAAHERPDMGAEVFNVAVGRSATLTELWRLIIADLPDVGGARTPIFGPPRAGDIRHSLADVSRIQAALGYKATHTLEEGLREARAWYVRQADARNGAKV